MKRKKNGIRISKKDVKKYYKNGKQHREDGPAVIYPDGTVIWKIESKRHREDGPAVIYKDGRKEWWLNGKRHRVDGPAIICTNGSEKYYLNDIEYYEDSIEVKMIKRHAECSKITPTCV